MLLSEKKKLLFLGHLQIANLFEPGLSLAVALPEKGSALLSGEQAQTILTELLRDGSFTAIDIKHLIEQVYPASSADKACISDQEVLDATFFDISLAAYVANSNDQIMTSIRLLLLIWDGCS